MNDSDLFQETYIPINKQLEIKERDLESPVPFTIKVQTRKWKDLYDVETESICLSIIAPYHIIGKIAKALDYGFKLFYFCYMFLCILFYYTFYLYTQLLIPVCEKKKWK